MSGSVNRIKCPGCHAEIPDLPTREWQFRGRGPVMQAKRYACCNCLRKFSIVKRLQGLVSAPTTTTTTTGLDGNNKVTSYQGVTNNSPHTRDGLARFLVEPEGGRR